MSNVAKKIYFVIPTKQSENKTMRTNNSLWWPQQLHIQSTFVPNSGWQNPISFLNYTCIYGWFIFLLQSLNIPFFSIIGMWFHTKFWYINVSYMMTEPLGLLWVYSVEVNCFALEIFECKKKCMLLQSLKPPHQNYTSFLHTQMDK